MTNFSGSTIWDGCWPTEPYTSSRADEALSAEVLAAHVQRFNEAALKLLPLIDDSFLPPALAAEIAQLRTSGISERRVQSLYPYDFESYTPAVQRMLKRWGLNRWLESRLGKISMHVTLRGALHLSGHETFGGEKLPDPLHHQLMRNLLHYATATVHLLADKNAATAIIGACSGIEALGAEFNDIEAMFTELHAKLKLPRAAQRALAKKSNH